MRAYTGSGSVSGRPASSWTALFEAVHSAWMHVLSEKQGEGVLTLGLPTRLNAWEWPQGLIPPYEALYCEAELGSGQKALLAAAWDQTASRVLDADFGALWKAQQKALGTELHRRSLRPRLSAALPIPPTGAIPEICQRIRPWVWVPVELGGGIFAFGMGVFFTRSLD